MQRAWRWGLGLVVIGGLALAACGEQSDDGPATGAPQAVAPVEVTADDTAEVTAEATAADDPAETPEQELTRLRARVAELEQQIAATEAAAPSGTQTAPVPVPVPGADAPEDPAATNTATGTQTASAGTTEARNGSAGSSSRRGRERDPSLLGALLGDDEGNARRPRTNTDEDNRDLRLPNPANILLGE